jgi:uncharacterized protein YqgC (DUF456 family)
MLTTLTILAYIILALTALAGLAIAFIGFPGTWLILAGFILGDLVFPGPGHFTAWGVALGLALLAEVAEWVMGYFGMRKYGVSGKAAWGAIIGSFIGAIVGVGIPVLGSLIGALLGAFLGAFIVEAAVSAHLGDAVKSGWGGLVGRLAGIFSKTLCAGAMVIVVFYAIIK